eukprot:5385800-Prymnesium_polylepis.1
MPHRRLPAAEEAAHARVSALDRSPAAAHQHDRCHLARALGARVRDAQLLPGPGLPVRPDAAHHRLRLRGCRRDVPRDDAAGAAGRQED